MKDIVHSLTILASDGTVNRLEKEALRFSYRKLEVSALLIYLKGYQGKNQAPRP